MAKAKAPTWLREAFSRGVDAYTVAENGISRVGAYEGANRFCWLARFDPAHRPCTPGPLERFHFIRRQDVEGAMWAQLPYPGATTPGLANMDEVPYLGPILTVADRNDLILVAAWDPRNGGLGCEQHHRRYDNHQVSLPRERVIVPYSALPSRVVQFGFDYSEGRLLDRFPSSI